MSKNFFVIFFSCLNLLAFTSIGQNSVLPVPSNGSYKLYFLNGKVKEKGHYKNSQKTGIWYFYDENRQLLKKEKFIGGELQWQLFFEKGKIVKIIDKNGKVTERSKCGC